MNRGDFFPTAYFAAVAGAKLATGKTPAAAIGRFLFGLKTRRYSIPGDIGLKNVRMGIEIDGITHWADDASHAEWSGEETGEAKFTFQSPAIEWQVQFSWESDGQALIVSSRIENRGHQPLKLGEGRARYGPNKGFYPGTFVINKPDYWTSHRTGLCSLIYYFAHRKLYLADSGSVMTIDKPIPLGDAQISVTIFGINGGPVMLGDDVDRMDEDRMLMVRMIFPRLPECARPLDLFDYAELDYPQVFHMKVEREWEYRDLLAVFNLSDHTMARTFPLERLKLDPKGQYSVFDFWNLRYQGVETSGSISVEVPPDSVKLLRIAPYRDHPWLISTDMHVRQGQAEILDCNWDQDAMTLTIRAQRPAGHEGGIYVHAPKGLAPDNPKGLWLARDGRDNSLIIRKPIELTGKPVEVQMRFKRY